PPEQLVVVVDCDGLTAHQHLASPEDNTPLSSLGVHVICLVDDQRAEPEMVSDRVVVGDDGSMRLASRSGMFTMDPIRPGVEQVVARQLSALRLTAESGEDGSLTDTVGLPEILGVGDPARLDLSSSW